MCGELVSKVLVTTMGSWGAERISGRKLSNLQGLVVCLCEGWVIFASVALGWEGAVGAEAVAPARCYLAPSALPRHHHLPLVLPIQVHGSGCSPLAGGEQLCPSGVAVVAWFLPRPWTWLCVMALGSSPVLCGVEGTLPNLESALCVAPCVLWWLSAQTPV